MAHLRVMPQSLVQSWAPLRTCRRDSAFVVDARVDVMTRSTKVLSPSSFQDTGSYQVEFLGKGLSE